MEIKGFIETSFVDWPGRICAVLFLPYCNLRCPFCHNHELVLEPEQFQSIPWEYVEKRLLSLRGWLDGVCITGGEPTLHPDLPELLDQIHQLGFSSKLDTNGTHPEVLRSLISRNLVDYMAMDIKGPLDQETYSRCVGVEPPLAHIKESMELLVSGKVAGEFRTTVVPHIHTSLVLARMAEELRQAPMWRCQEFNPANALDVSLRSGGASGQMLQ
jgi:pyruvate formate lyase activating enzyme